MSMNTASVTHGIDTFTCRWEDDALVVEPRERGNGRTVLFVAFVGGAETFESWMVGRHGGHNLWGCRELAEQGYRVVMPRVPRARHSLLRHVVTDWRAAIRHARRLRPDDIVYCNHNVMLWTPLLAAVRAVRARLVGLLYAREPLPLAGAYHGIACMTRAAFDHASALRTRAHAAHIPWGIELSEHVYAYRPYEPRWGLHCGITGRDIDTVARAFEGCDYPLKVCSRGRPMGNLPPSVQVETRGVSPEALANELFRYAAFLLISLQPDPKGREAVGCTNLLEAMALGRPVIQTQTGSLPGDIDVEAEGIGLYVPPRDPAAVRAAVQSLVHEPERAEAMGRRGRALAESFYNTDRFGRQLHELFSRL